MPHWVARGIVPILCVFVIFGAALYSVFAPAPVSPALTSAVDTETVIEGVVSRDPDIREKFIFLTVDVDTVNEEQTKGRILASVDRFSDISYGDRITVSGKLKLPEPFETDGGRTFDYPKYLLAHGVTHTVQFADVEVLGSGEGNVLVATLLGLKHALVEGIQRALPEPESALLAGLLLGEKQSLGEKITESFRNAGVVHIIVLSGYNVALVIGAILFIAQRIFSRGVALAVAGVGILAFVVMTGATETGVRASVMALIVLLAQFLRRPTEGVRILLIAGAGMALFNPYLVLFDLSYQLSMLATLGLVLFSNPLQKRMQFVPETLGLREIVATTVATQITVLPLLIFSIGSVSVVSLIANILVLPAVPAAMLFGFVAAIVSLLSSVLAFPFTALAYAILHYIIQISVWLGSFSFSAFAIPAELSLETLGMLLALYALAFLFVSKSKTIN
ncbi:ComEC family competence protein [Patescibacteria group bacterium]|nr:ComEC family competence protein [Patescibacteria group bacterium]